MYDLGLLSRAFSWPGFLVTTRLSYAIYLVQFPVFFYNVGRTRHAGYFSFLSYTVGSNHYTFVAYFPIWLVWILSFQLNLNENIAITLSSIALTIFFDTPFQNIKKIIFNSSNKPLSASPVSVEKIENVEGGSEYAKELKFEWEDRSFCDFVYK